MISESRVSLPDRPAGGPPTGSFDLIDFHSIKDIVVEIGQLLWCLVQLERPGQLFLAKSCFGGLAPGQVDFDHIATFRLAAETAGA